MTHIVASCGWVEAAESVTGQDAGMRAVRHRWDPRCEAPRSLVRPVRVDLSGTTGPTKAQASGPRWRRTSKGYYVPASVTDDLPEQRVLEQAMRLPAGGAVTGWAACRLLGAAFFDGLARDGRTRLRVPLWVGNLAQLTQDEHVRVHRDAVVAAEVTSRHGIPCSRPLRAVFDASRDAADLREAVGAIDMMAAAELASVSQLREYVAAQDGVRGVDKVRSALDLASEDSRSPNETRVRLIWQLDAGLPRPLVNQPVFDLAGRLLGIVDLLDPAAGVVGEYDGADHRSARRHSADVDRESRLRAAGLEVFRVTGPDLARKDLVVQRILAARRRASWIAGDRRAWTVVPPPDWPVEMPLHDRLEQRAEWEALEGSDVHSM